jgi:hypothetical protein
MPPVHAATVAYRGDHLVAKALLTMQAGFGLVGTLGLVVVMGFNPWYAVLPGLQCVFLVILGEFVGRPRNWALTATIIVEGVSLAGWIVQVLVGLLPPVDFTVNLVGLLTMLALPVAVTVLCARGLAR